MTIEHETKHDTRHASCMQAIYPIAHERKLQGNARRLRQTRADLGAGRLRDETRADLRLVEVQQHAYNELRNAS